MTVYVVWIEGVWEDMDSYIVGVYSDKTKAMYKAMETPLWQCPSCISVEEHEIDDSKKSNLIYQRFKRSNGKEETWMDK